MVRTYYTERRDNLKDEILATEEELEDIKAEWMKEDDEAVADEKYGEWIEELETKLRGLRFELMYG